MRKLTFLLKSDFMVNVRFELTTTDPCPADDAICEGLSPLGERSKVNQSPTQSKPHNMVPCTALSLNTRNFDSEQQYFIEMFLKFFGTGKYIFSCNARPSWAYYSSCFSTYTYTYVCTTLYSRYQLLLGLSTNTAWSSYSCLNVPYIQVQKVVDKSCPAVPHHLYVVSMCCLDSIRFAITCTIGSAFARRKSSTNIYIHVYCLYACLYIVHTYACVGSRINVEKAKLWCGSSVVVKVLVRWATGKRLTSRLPNQSLITLSPPGTDR